MHLQSCCRCSSHAKAVCILAVMSEDSCKTCTSQATSPLCDCRGSEAVNLWLLTWLLLSQAKHSLLQDIKDADSVSLGALMASQVSVPVVQDIRDADAVILRALMASQVQMPAVQDIKDAAQ